MTTIRCETGNDVQVPGDSLVGASLAGADLHRALLDGANLEGADLRNASLRSSCLERANMDRVDFTGATLAGSHASRASFRRAVFTASILRSGSFDGADFTNANLAGAKAGHARFRGAILRGADMRCEELETADLTGAIADSKTRWPIDFHAADAGVQNALGATEDELDRMKVLWKLPAPSSADLEPTLDAQPGVCTLSFAMDVDRQTRGSITFLGVVSYRAWFDAISADLLRAYDKLIELDDTEWLAESRRSARHTRGELRHLRICFDDGPCYEFICAAVRFPS